MEPKSYNYLPIGRGDQFVKNGEFVVTGHHALLNAATEFLASHNAKPQEVDTGFMGIMGPLVLDTKDEEVDHQRCGYPRVVKFALVQKPEGAIAKLVYSFDHFDLSTMQGYLNRP